MKAFPTMTAYSRFVFITLMLLLMGGCASVSGPADENDPFESFNRAAHDFNMDLDKAILRPVTETYAENVPNPIQSGVHNFLSNLDDVLVMFNNILQFKFANAASDFSRIAWNSTVGLFGLFDVASELELPKHNEDFGQTLAVWGVPDGPYLVLPFFGPRTLRDTGGLVVDTYTDPLYSDLIKDRQARVGATALRFIDARKQLLGTVKIMEQSGIDPYLFMRNAYLQHRRNLIYDGSPPDDQFMDIDPNADADLELELELEGELNQTNTPDKTPAASPAP